MRQVCITIDVEHDCPPYLQTYRGIERGIPSLLPLLEKEQVPATFFITGDVARRYPEVVRTMVDSGHEIGCHGDTHDRFSRLEKEAAKREIGKSTEELRKYYPVSSFRAPYLDFPVSYLPILQELGYQLDSSQGRHKSLSAKISKGPVLRIPASLPPSWLRVHPLFSRLLLGLMRNPLVLFFHPWEFIDVTREPIPRDCRYRTGSSALDSLRQVIHLLKDQQAGFYRISELSKFYS